MSLPLVIDPRDLDLRSNAGNAVPVQSVGGERLRITCPKYGLGHLAFDVTPRLEARVPAWDIHSHDGASLSGYSRVWKATDVVPTIIEYLEHDLDLVSLGRENVPVPASRHRTEHVIPGTENVVPFSFSHGNVLLCSRIATGMYYVTAEKGGGFFLSEERQAVLPRHSQSVSRFYEDTGAHAGVIGTFPDCFTRSERRDAAAILSRLQPIQSQCVERQQGRARRQPTTTRAPQMAFG